LGGFTQNTGHASAQEAELCAAIFVIEKAAELNRKELWIESDSLMVVRCFDSRSVLPWRLKTRWQNCMVLVRKLGGICTHIHREGNLVADALAQNGQSLALSTSQWWSEPPHFLLSLLYHDSLGVPHYRTIR